MLLLVLSKEFFTSKTHLVVVAITGLFCYVLYYGAIKRGFKGLQFHVAAGAGASLGGLFTSIGVIYLATQDAPCPAYDEVRWYVALGGVALAWVAIQSIASKIGAVVAVKPIMAMSIEEIRQEMQRRGIKE